MKKELLVTGFLIIQALLMACNDPGPAFSPGAADPRITGTWRLVERRFQRDSAFSVPTPRFTTRRDSFPVLVNGQPLVKDGRIVKKDSVIVERDTIFVRRDTSFYTTKRYPAELPQTLTFNADGQLSAGGTEMSYYYPIKYFRVDSVDLDGAGVRRLAVNLFISTNRATVAFRQGVAFRRDTLELQPRCEQRCYLKLVRAQ